jgi:hypothetical protein
VIDLLTMVSDSQGRFEGSALFIDASAEKSSVPAPW